MVRSCRDDWSYDGCCWQVLCFSFQDLEFKIIYVGSAETYEFDQVLDQIVVDAVPQGQFKFMFQVCCVDLQVDQVVDSG